ncbi:MAG: LCP family protein [Christensenellales bacterium]|jgi:LCP family protein required for cell wall assembly
MHDDEYREQRGSNPPPAGGHPKKRKKKLSKKAKRRRTVKRVLITFLIVLLVIGLALGGYIFSAYYRAWQNINANMTGETPIPNEGDITVHPDDYIEISSDDLDPNESLGGEWRNVLLLGSDSRSRDVKGNSDTILIASVNSKSGAVKLTSIMRDSYVNIPGKGKHKINAAYAYGGVNLAMKTINQNFNMNITDYAIVNFANLASIIDEIGGINVTVTDAERRLINEYMEEQKKSTNGHNQDFSRLDSAGENVHLTGQQAVAFSRIRAIGNDYQRTERQRTVLEAMLRKVKSTTNVLTAMDLATRLLPYVETNMNIMDVMGLAPAVLGNKDGVEQARIPFEGTYSDNNSDGQWNIILDVEQNAQKLHEFIYGN